MTDSGTPIPPQGPVYASPTPATSLSGVPQGLTSWMTFVAIMTILSGILNILSCFGMITGVLMLVGGLALMGAKTALESVTQIDASLVPFFLKFKTFIVTAGWVYIIGLILIVIFIFIWGSVMLAAVAAAIAEAS